MAVPGLTKSYAEARYARSSYVDIRSFGAVVNTDCTAAFDAARAASNSIYVPAGAWNYNGDGLNWQGLSLRGSLRGSSIISLGAGKSLVVGTGTSPNFTLSDLSIRGGFGGVRLTGTGPNVSSEMGLSIRRVAFFNFTGAAISEAFSDCPNWTIRECSFYGANETTTIGIILSGDCADSVIAQCNFARTAVSVKFVGGYGGNATTIRDCSFVRASPYTSNRRTDVWIVPPAVGNPSNQAVHIDSCKLGPENRAGTDCAVLVARQDPATADYALSLPDLTAITGFEARALRITNCLTGGNSPTPIILSATPNLPLLEMSSISLSGALPSSLVQFVDPTAVQALSSGDEGKVSGLLNKDAGVSTVVPLSNATRPIATVINDPLGTIDTGGGRRNGGVGDKLGYVKTLAGTYIAGSGATLTAITDSIGGTDATEVTGSTGAPAYTYLPISGFTAQKTHWVECDIAPPTSGTAPADIFVTLATSSNTIERRWRVKLPTGWGKFRFSHMTSSAVTPTQLRFFTADNNTGFKVGRVRAYHASEPAIDDAVNAIAGPGSTIWLQAQMLAQAIAVTTVVARDAGTGLPLTGAMAWADGTTGTYTGVASSSGLGYSSLSATYGNRTVSATGITYDTTSGSQLGPTSVTVT